MSTWCHKCGLVWEFNGSRECPSCKRAESLEAALMSLAASNKDRERLTQECESLKRRLAHKPDEVELRGKLYDAGLCGEDDDLPTAIDTACGLWASMSDAYAWILCTKRGALLVRAEAAEDLLSTLVYWHGQGSGHIDDSWWEAAKELVEKSTAPTPRRKR